MRISKNAKSFAIKSLLCAALFAVEILIALIEYDRTVSIGFWSQYMRHFFLPTLPFVVLYVVHDVLLVPVLMNRRNIPLYLSLTFLLVCAFSGYILYGDEPRPGGAPEPAAMNERHRFNMEGDAPEDIGRQPMMKDLDGRPVPERAP